MKRKISSRGFTLIELVMVIVILGILAATAVPKFSDLSQKAKRSAIVGVVGGVKAGIGIFQAGALVNDKTNGDLYNTVATTALGYPTTLDAASGDATVGNPYFVNVLGQGGVTENWTKASLAYSAIADSTYTYTYVPVVDAFTGGTFNLTGISPP